MNLASRSTYISIIYSQGFVGELNLNPEIIGESHSCFQLVQGQVYHILQHNYMYMS